MKTYHYTLDNANSWRITDTEIVVIAEDKTSAKKALNAAGYKDVTTKELVELKMGVHVIQEEITE